MKPASLSGMRRDLQKGLLVVSSGLIASLIVQLAIAEEAGGKFTISRELPMRNAFRPASPGTPVQVATAPEGSISTLSDAVLESLGSTRRAEVHAVPLPISSGVVPIANSHGVAGPIARATSSVGGSPMRALPVGAGASNTNAFAAMRAAHPVLSGVK